MRQNKVLAYKASSTQVLKLPWMPTGHALECGSLLPLFLMELAPGVVQPPKKNTTSQPLWSAGGPSAPRHTSAPIFLRPDPFPEGDGPD